MEGFLFLNLEGLSDVEVRDLNDLINFGNPTDKVEFPWSHEFTEDPLFPKGDGSSLNVHAPVFESCALKASSHPFGVHAINESYSSLPVTNPELFKRIGTPPFSASSEKRDRQFLPADCSVKNAHSNGIQQERIHKEFMVTSDDKQSTLDVRTDSLISQEATIRNFNAPQYSQASFAQVKSKVQLNPSASSFVPQTSQLCILNGGKTQNNTLTTTPPSSSYETVQSKDNDVLLNGELTFKPECGKVGSVLRACDKVANHTQEKTLGKELEVNKKVITDKDLCSTAPVVTASPRSWADVLKSGSDESQTKSPKNVVENGRKPEKCVPKEVDISKSSISEDKLSLLLGKHLHNLELSFQPVFLQPRGLINRRNWCYINATLQALLSCPPFYTLLRNLPIGLGVDRGKSSTPVIDSMVKVAYEFTTFSTFQEDMQPGVAFQPKHFYEMLGDLKSDCLKGQQEDAEEFLSYILNGMHEEMVALIKNFEKEHHLNDNKDPKLNGCADASDGEDDWQEVIGTKQKGMVTRKVVEHKTPVSDLLGGQIRSVLTISGSKPSASVQPFFTLQLDIQSENVSSVIEALNQMTVKEPIQGYTCAKTKQEVEAYSRIALQKLPPILILHLKRFVYNKNGGCKKVMKKTEYPIKLELTKELFSTDVKRSRHPHCYNLFAVMYHDGEEAVKGHYISDIYNHSIKSWIRCDDRTITNVTEEQVLSHSPPRVPYLLFYQVSDNSLASSL